MQAPDLPPPLFAIVTPFAVDGGLDLGALRAQLGFLHERGVPSVIAGGTTGEFCSLTGAERRALLAATRRHFPGRVLANASADNAVDAHGLVAQAAEHADAVLLLPPAYFRAAPPAGLRAWYAEVLAGCTSPVLLYDFPRHTGNPLTGELTRALIADLPVIVGFKDSSGELEHARSVATALPPGAPVFFGGDVLAAAALEADLRPVSGGAVPVPELLVDLVAAHRAGDHEGRQRCAAVLSDWTAARKALGIPEIATIKAALALRLPGFPATVRPPLIPAPPSASAALKRALAAAGIAGI